MTRCREAGALTNHFTQLLVGLQLWLEETLRKCNNRSKDAAPAAAVPQVSLEAHVHLQQFINSLPLSVPLLSTHTHTHTQWSHEQETSMVLHTTCMGFFHEMQPFCQKKKILEQSAIFSSIKSSFVRDGQKCKNCIIVSTHRFHFHDSLTQHKIVPLQLT